MGALGPATPRYRHGLRRRLGGWRIADVEVTGVEDRLEVLVQGIAIDALVAGPGVDDVESDFDVGQAGGEEPEVVEAGESAGVDRLDDELDVGVVEEPEVARVRSQRLGMAAAARAGVGRIGGADAEAVVVEAEGRGVSGARRRRKSCRPGRSSPRRRRAGRSRRAPARSGRQRRSRSGGSRGRAEYSCCRTGWR